MTRPLQAPTPAASALSSPASQPALVQEASQQAKGCTQAPADKSPHARQRRPQARPQELLEAALTLFVEKGFAATRAEEVARMAGVSKGTLYLYYPSKDELLKAVIQHYVSQVIVEGGEIADQFEGSAADLLRLLAQTWWARIGQSKASGLLMLIMSESHKFPEIAQYYVDEVVAPSHALLSKVVRRGVAQGEFRELDVNSVVHALTAPAKFLIIYRHCTAACANNPAPVDPETFMDTQLDLLLKGLEVRQP